MLRLSLALLAVLTLSRTAAAQELKFSPSSPIRDGEVVEVFVDERGDIYRELRYHGVVPNVRDDVGRKRPNKHDRVKKGAPKAAVTWVGFQQQRFSSRVFAQVRNLTHYSITKPSPTKIVLFVDGAKVPGRQTRRPLVTSQYQSSVAGVQARQRKGGTEITITLNRPAGYLYKQEGRYVFIDVER